LHEKDFFLNFKLVRQQFRRLGEVDVVGVAVCQFWETRLLPLGVSSQSDRTCTNLVYMH